jgi:hypothetical protein
MSTQQPEGRTESVQKQKQKQKQKQETKQWHNNDNIRKIQVYNVILPSLK